MVMTLHTSTIQIRIDEKTKNDAQKTLAKLGLDLSSATKIFLRKVINTKSIPFDIRTENGFTPSQEFDMLKDLDKTIKKGKRFSSAQDMFDHLDEKIGKKK